MNRLLLCMVIAQMAYELGAQSVEQTAETREREAEGGRADVGQIRVELEGVRRNLREVSSRVDRMQTRALEREIVRLRSERPQPRSPVVSVPFKAARATPNPVDADDVRCPTDGRCVLSRSFYDEVMERPARLASHARVVPFVQDGVQRGFKLYGLRPNSLPKALGLKNGDLLTAVNGAPLDSLEAVLRIFDRLGDATGFTIDLERRGEGRRVSIQIADADDDAVACG